MPEAYTLRIIDPTIGDWDTIKIKGGAGGGGGGLGSVVACGGGGGGGGVLTLIYTNLISGTESVAGGAFGLGAVSEDNGTDGTDGTLIELTL